ncbi:glycosyltransferase 87 family protein [Parashewanella tropica]|uniref:glycosyltransferase 87 family protein n=1 Tax=Parashewanella tropica TaxID=2547970 RepID=UPI001059820F|nr:glycosyltransferase 87 family protein [Parashewanella tropica]
MIQLISHLQQNLPVKARTWLHITSLAGVVLSSLASHWLSEFKTTPNSPHLAEMGIYIIIQFSVMGLFMLLAWATAPASNALKDFKLILIAAVIARVVLLDVAPYTSNDVDRYLFDGRIAYEGFDPYRVSHDAPELQELRAQWQPPQEHAKYVTLYPPVALSFFALAASADVDNAQLAWSAILLVSGLLTLYFSAQVLQKLGKLKHLPLVALSPLLILETGVGLHLDALSALTVIVAVYLWLHQRFVLTGIMIGIGMSTKILPMMLLLPFLFFLLGKKEFKTFVTLLASTIVAIASIYSLTIALGYHPVGSISVFFEKWRFASPLFNSLDAFISGYPLIFTLMTIATIICLLIGFFSLSSTPLASKDSKLGSCLQLALSVPLFLGPVLFPWYLMPLIPLLALRPNLYLIAWTLLMPLTYEVIGNFLCCQQWQPAQWPIIILGILYLITTIKLTKWLYQNKSQLKLKSHLSNDNQRMSTCR